MRIVEDSTAVAYPTDSKPEPHRSVHGPESAPQTL